MSGTLYQEDSAPQTPLDLIKSSALARGTHTWLLSTNCMNRRTWADFLQQEIIDAARRSQTQRFHRVNKGQTGTASPTSRTCCGVIDSRNDPWYHSEAASHLSWTEAQMCTTACKCGKKCIFKLGAEWRESWCTCNKCQIVFDLIYISSQLVFYHKLTTGPVLTIPIQIRFAP